jgi:hypothetical protein
MDLKLWQKDHFTLWSMPDWPCPTCKKGILDLEKEKFYKEESASSIKLHKDPDWDSEWITYTFSGVLRCSNKKCHDFVAFGGTGRHLPGDQYDAEKKKWVDTSMDIYSPKYFVPVTHVFDINKKCPSDIADEIVAAFALLWNDVNACANKIRSVIELILTEQGVEKKIGNGKFIGLHKRLNSFKLLQPEIADFFTAIKFIGNDGSHSGEEITRGDVLNAFELLEYTVEKIYDNNAERLRLLSIDIINAYQKPQSDSSNAQSETP